MFLPFKENAIIKPNKISDYLLSETHLVGKNKSKFFRIIGFGENNLSEFIKELLEIKENEVDEIIKNEFGTKYVINGEISAPNGRFYKIITVWMLENENNSPYLITCYPY